jgi:RimJ/RimL family protein N-acetyltransferase
MKTITKNITLSPGLDDATLSPESLSKLIDTWSELQTSAVEAVQAPTPNLFSFAETCFFFAVISQNEPLPSGDSGHVFPKTDELLEEIEQEEFERAIRRSTQEAGASPNTVAPNDAAGGLWDEFTSAGAGGAQRPNPFEGTSLGSYDGKRASHNSATRIYDAEEDITDRSEADFSLEHNLFKQAHSNAGVFHEARENSLLPSLSRQIGPPTSTFSPYDSSYNRGYSVPHNNIDNMSKPKTAIGIVYLTCSPHENVPAGEANIGIILTPETRGKGFAREAIGLVLSWVFDEIGFHRVQAGILDNYNKDRAISMFTQL